MVALPTVPVRNRFAPLAEAEVPEEGDGGALNEGDEEIEDLPEEVRLGRPTPDGAQDGRSATTGACSETLDTLGDKHAEAKGCAEDAYELCADSKAGDRSEIQCDAGGTQWVETDDKGPPDGGRARGHDREGHGPREVEDGSDAELQPKAGHWHFESDMGG